jgi:CheY-like chemotaxis protein
VTAKKSPPSSSNQINFTIQSKIETSRENQSSIENQSIKRKNPPYREKVTSLNREPRIIVAED